MIDTNIVLLIEVAYRVWHSLFSTIHFSKRKYRARADVSGMRIELIISSIPLKYQ